MLGTGSSPLARGTWRTSMSSRLRTRLIPARAGNIRAVRSQPQRPAAHPRSRGEHSERSSMPEPVTGSSPLARGTYGASGRGDGAGRLIPARAGNIHAILGLREEKQAHPRSRGEHPWAGLDSGNDHRLIPARAGNISAGPSLTPMLSAHPRSRGEHVTAFSSSFVASGSSPLARGT